MWKRISQCIFLVRHSEFRHPTINQSSAFSIGDDETTESYSNEENQCYYSNSKRHAKSNENEPYIMKIEVNETDVETFNLTFPKAEREQQCPRIWLVHASKW